MFWFARSTAVMLTGALGLLAASGPAPGADRSQSRTISVTIKATGRDGGPGVVGEDAVAVSLSPGTRGSQYRASPSGVLSIPPGKYLLAADITSSPVAPATSDSETLAARVLTVTRKVTVTFDARQAKPLVLALDKPGAVALVTSAGLCYGTGAGAQPLVAGDVSAGTGMTSLYAIPFGYQDLSFGYAGNWRDSAGVQYVTSGVHPGGIPAKPDYSFRVPDLAKLTFQVTSGAAAGGDGSWSIRQVTGCSLGNLPGRQPVPVPSQTTQYVSAGPWLISFFPDDHTGQSGTQVAVNLRAGQKLVQKLQGAVVAPARWAIPRYAVNGRNNFSMPLYGFFSGSDGGTECCSDGVLKLSTGGKVIHALTFKNEASGLFTTRLRRAGWYGLTIDVTRAAPPLGVAPAVLSNRASLTWRFRVSSGDLTSSGSGAPVSVSTFVPEGLSASNEAAPNTVTPLRMRVWRGRATRAFGLKTVQLQISLNNGATWRRVPLTAHGSYWLAEVPGSAAGFVSLRSTVTDVRGDRTVETVYRAYGIS